MIRTLLSLAISLLFFTSFRRPEIPLYKDPKAPIEARVNDLLQRMTIEEKVGQLGTLLGWKMYTKEQDEIGVSDEFKKAIQQKHIGMLWATLRADPWTQKTLETGLSPLQAAETTNALQRYMVDSTRLGIPLLLSEECPHGHMAIGSTVFPTAIGQASTWDAPLIKQMAQAIAAETRSVGAHIGYGPILDLAREPRWSRLEETYGEDPVLNEKMGVAMVNGFQGLDGDLAGDKNIGATLKHFVAYGVPEGGHNGGFVNVGQRELLQAYLPPFKAAIKAGALSIMTAYNAIDGIPCTANAWLLKNQLRDEWKFSGFSVSDLGSISGLAGSHRVAKNASEAAALAINAGLDADLSGYGYGDALFDAIKQQRVTIATLDTAVSRVLRIKFVMGLFENPYVNTQNVSDVVRRKEHISLARQVAQKSIILLKNENNALPLNKVIKKIAIIGPNADNIYNQLGDYTAPQAADAVVTVLDGIKNKVGEKTEVLYAKGCDIRDTNNTDIESAVNLARDAEVAVVVLGGSSARDFKTTYQETGAAKVSSSDVTLSDMESGEGFDRSNLDLLGSQLELLKAVKDTGTPVILVTIKGRPLNLNWAEDNIPAIVDAWYPGQEGGNAIADVLFGDVNPAGRLTVSVPKSVGQLPVYYNYKNPKKHDYVEIDAKPLYAFGYGLSYTNFEYNNLRIENRSTKDNIDIRVKCQIKNTGRYDGDEVPQLYIKDLYSSVVTPNIQLKDFQRVHIEAGKSTNIEFNLTEKDLALVDANMNWVVEHGDFEVLIGSSSDNIKLQDTFSIK